MKLSNVLDRLFVSKTRQKLINLFFSHPTELYYVRQLVRLAEEEINSVRRELDNLKKANLINSEWRSNRLYYWANLSHPLLVDLVSLASKTSGFGLALQEKKVGQVRFCAADYFFLLNQPKSKNAIDILIVGDVSVKEVDHIIKAEEESRGREINYMIMDRAEIQIRRLKRDPFMVDFFLSQPLVIIGSPKDIL
ncbi:MAG: hypothetical protein WC686_02295 [Candidatus Shapirobacteria bacterium]|jgi:hypothetical protein